MPVEERALRTFVLISDVDTAAAWTIVQLGLLGINPDH